jgi:citrate lyase subunit beta/citryl-CoA lyase
MNTARFARSLLFVPGDRPERFAKAARSGADLIVIDLEDAVAPPNKERALDNALTWLGTARPTVVRINGAGTEWHGKEIDALSRTAAVIMLPKAENPDVVEQIHRRLAAERLIALVETARGLRDIDAVCAAPGVIRAALGTVDLGAELGIDPGDQAALAYARSRLVAAAAAANLPAPLDGVTTVLRDSNLLDADLQHARRLGFGGKLCIHPLQVDSVNTSFRPTPNEIDWALKVTSAANSSAGAVVVDGSMVDPPVVRRAELIIQAWHTR